jgi:phage repressor protein C with HTH and peptisase S24 domain
MTENKRIKNVIFYLISQDIIISQEDFSNKIGYNPSSVSQIVCGKKPLSEKFANKVTDTFKNINSNYLFGRGDMLKNDFLEEKNSNLNGNQNGNLSEKTEKKYTVPLIPFDAVAGFGSSDNAGISYEDCERYAVPEFERSGVEFVVRVSGSSMYPKYSNGDVLACRKIYDILFFQWGKIYVIDSCSQGILVKRIYEDTKNPDNIILVSDNKEKYPPHPMPKSDIRSLSIVLGVIRME